MQVLLVDDNQLSLAAIKELLEATPDLRVRAATNGERALQIAQDWHGVDLLIAEIFMEPMNGFTLRNKMGNRFPGIRTIFISQYDASDYREYWEGCEVLIKPLEPKVVLAAIARTFVPVAAEAEESEETAAAAAETEIEAERETEPEPEAETALSLEEEEGEEAAPAPVESEPLQAEPTLVTQEPTVVEQEETRERPAVLPEVEAIEK